MGMWFTPRNSVFPCQCYSTSASYSSFSYQRDKRAKPGNLPTISSVWEPGAFDRKLPSHFSSSKAYLCLYNQLFALFHYVFKFLTP
jgi:hypothetical protein